MISHFLTIIMKAKDRTRFITDLIPTMSDRKRNTARASKAFSIDFQKGVGYSSFPVPEPALKT
jgi:hypothetical protein